MTDDPRILFSSKPHVPVTFVVPTHPARGAADDPSTLLGRAVASIYAQTVTPAGGISIACDLNGDGAGKTRERALADVSTEFASYLDSDDWAYPHHLATHWALITNNGAGYPDATSADGYADVAYSWWGGNRPFPEETHRGIPFDPEHPHHITVTLTVRTALAKAAGFGSQAVHPDWAGDDWIHIVRLCELGARFVGTGEETWFYDASHGGNTSGHPWRGDGPAVTR